MRFYFFYPTWTKPSGGNKQLRLMASLMKELGATTYLLRDQEFFAAAPAFDDNVFYSVPMSLAPFSFEDAGDHLAADDVLVLPEVLLDRTLPRCMDWTCRIALNNQNGYYALRYAAPRRLCASRIEFAIANAPYVAAICQTYLGIAPARVFNIPYWVARPPFEVPAKDEPRQLGVCYMPRKLPLEVRRVRETVEAIHPEVPWIEIDNMTEDEVARRMRAISVFFAAQDLEGFGLPALEAMACGTLVAGFAGTGKFTHPYATPDNGVWVADRDVRAAADAVCRAIDVVREGGEPYRKYMKGARRTAEDFTKEPVLASLRELLTVVENREYESRRAEAVRLDWRATLYAYRQLYNYDRLGWPGRLVSWISSITKPVRDVFVARNA